MNSPDSKVLLEKKKLAIVYLLKNRQEIPDHLDKFFNKLIKYENSAKSIEAAASEASETLKKLYSENDKLIGSILSIMDLIIDELPDNESVVWADKLGDLNLNPNGPAYNYSEVKEPTDIDMAGSTAKTIK